MNKKVTKKQTDHIEESPTSTKPISQPKKSASHYRIPKLYAHLGLAVLVVAGVAAFLAVQNFLTLATVNGESINRLELVKRLESNSGKDELEMMITELLINQEASTQSIVIEDEVINQEIEKIKTQLASSGNTLEEVLAQEGLTLENLEKQIKLQKKIEAIAGVGNSQPSAEEIATFLEENKEFLPEDATEEELNELAINQLNSQGGQQQIQDSITSLRDKATINYNKTY